MDLSGLSIADPRPSESDHQGSFGDPLSPRLRDKLNKLAKWRIDPSLIDLPENASEVEGGHATVSRALLTPVSAASADLNKPKNVEGGPSPRDGPTEKKAIAVKKLKTENDNNSERVLELALREAEFLVELSSPHIIKLNGFVEDLPKNRIWLIFPWEEYGNLKDFVASQDWEIPERICLIDDVAGGVEYLHSRSPPIYHGDLKSINVLVTSKCRAFITDFGSARRLAEKDADPQMKRTEKREGKAPTPDFCATFCAASNTMTFTGNEYTLRWAAPELLMDEEPGLSSDIWALGWIFYEVMTNSVPFENVQKDSMIIKNVIDGKLPIVKDHIRISLILRLSALMVKCWNINPTERPTADECRKWLDWMPMVIPVPQRGSDTMMSRHRSFELLLKMGDMYKAQDDCTNASVLYNEALNLCANSFNKEGMASAFHGLGKVHRAQYKYSKAATFYKEALQIYTELGDTKGRADALWDLAKVHSDQGEYDKAIELYSEVKKISFATGNKRQRADGLMGLAEVHRTRNNFDQAVTFYSEAVEIYADIGSISNRAIALWGLAEVYRLQTKYSEAVPLFSESLQISTDIGNRCGIANASFCLAHIHRDRDKHWEAILLYEQAAGIFEQIGNTKNAKKASAGASRCRRRLELAEAE